MSNQQVRPRMAHVRSSSSSWRMVGQREVIVVAEMGRFSGEHVSADLRSFLGIAKAAQPTQLSAYGAKPTSPSRRSHTSTGIQNPHPFSFALGRLCRKERGKDGVSR